MHCATVAMQFHLNFAQGNTPSPPGRFTELSRWSTVSKLYTSSTLDNLSIVLRHFTFRNRSTAVFWTRAILTLFSTETPFSRCRTLLHLIWFFVSLQYTKLLRNDSFGTMAPSWNSVNSARNRQGLFHFLRNAWKKSRRINARFGSTYSCLIQSFAI